MAVTIENMQDFNWPDVSTIYKEGMATGNATFEQSCPDWKDWDKSHREDCRLVAKINDEVIAWAALSNVSERCIYAGVCEVSVYVSSVHKGEGIGSLLLKTLIEESEKSGIWTLQAGIFPENRSSISIHTKLGFRQIGIREKVGKMNGVWRDVVLLERRSKVTGID